MDQLFTYWGYASATCSALLLVVEGAKKIAGLNGSDGPEDLILIKVDVFLHQASNFLAKFGVDFRKKQA